MYCWKVQFAIIFFFTYKPIRGQEDIKLADINNRFSFSLFKKFPQTENVFFSPPSIYMTLAMLFEGAREITALEMWEALEYNRFKLDDDNIHLSFEHLISILRNIPGDNVVDIANAMFIKTDFPVLFEYQRTLENYYDATVKDFSDDNQTAIKQINDWVGEKTNGKIMQIIDKVPEDVKIIMLNAIYFNGIWKTEFDPTLTTDETFYNNGTDAVTVKMMRVAGSFRCMFWEEAKLDVVEIPYKGDNISMLIVLPTHSEDLMYVEHLLDAYILNGIISKLVPTRLKVFLPKFQLESFIKFKDELIKLGIRIAFTHEADFEGINGNRDLYLSDIWHKSMIKIDEEGSVASSITYVEKTSRDHSSSVKFHVNHPFLFYILDRRSNMILFAGRVINL